VRALAIACLETPRFDQIVVGAGGSVSQRRRATAHASWFGLFFTMFGSSIRWLNYDVTTDGEDRHLVVRNTSTTNQTTNDKNPGEAGFALQQARQTAAPLLRRRYYADTGSAAARLRSMRLPRQALVQRERLLDQR